MTMPFSLSPHQLKQSIHIPSLSSLQLQPYSTSRQFTTVVCDGLANDHETSSNLKSRTQHLLTSKHGHTTRDEDRTLNEPASPRRVVTQVDLPPWTPLRTLANDANSSVSDSEVDELSTTGLKETDEATEPGNGRLPTNPQATMGDTATTGRTLKSLSDAQPLKRKKARFDGVLILTKPPPHKKHVSQTRPQPSRTVARNAQGSSLVDALARTFNANKHTEIPSRSPHAVSRESDADADTEDEQLQLNMRLARPLPATKRLARVRTAVPARAHASGANSEDAPHLGPWPGRPVKRLKLIQYESNAALVDVALGTVQAPISWEAELHLIAAGDDVISPMQIAQAAQVTHIASPDAQMAVDGPGSPKRSSGSPASRPTTPVGVGRRKPTHAGPNRSAVLSPYLSRGAKFRQRVTATFGDGATVRTDKLARPRPLDHDLYAQLDDLDDRVPSPKRSESTASVSAASTMEEDANAIPSSTYITSQSPDIPPSSPIDADASTGVDVGVDSTNHPPKDHPLNDVGFVNEPTPFDAGEEQTRVWIVTVQRLVKGKVRVKEQDLEDLSIVLAEIESVKDSKDGNVLMTPELRESVKQLSELHEIPFGDRNKLLKRAKNILHTWPSIGKSGAL